MIQNIAVLLNWLYTSLQTKVSALSKHWTWPLKQILNLAKQFNSQNNEVPLTFIQSKYWHQRVLYWLHNTFSYRYTIFCWKKAYSYYNVMPSESRKFESEFQVRVRVTLCRKLHTMGRPTTNLNLLHAH